MGFSKRKRRQRKKPLKPLMPLLRSYHLLADFDLGRNYKKFKEPPFITGLSKILATPAYSPQAAEIQLRLRLTKIENVKLRALAFVPYFYCEPGSKQINISIEADPALDDVPGNTDGDDKGFVQMLNKLVKAATNWSSARKVDLDNYVWTWIFDEQDLLWDDYDDYDGMLDATIE